MLFLQVADFVDRYMPAYETYLPALYTQGPQRAAARPELLQPVIGGTSDGDRKSDMSHLQEGTLCPVLKVSTFSRLLWAYNTGMLVFYISCIIVTIDYSGE